MAARDPEAPRYGHKDANEYARSSSHCGTHYAAGDPLRTDLDLGLYAEPGSPKFEKAALRWLERYLAEGMPRLEHFAEVAADPARRDA